MVVTGGAQKFYDHWRNDNSKSKFLDEFPYQLSLGINQRDRYSIPISVESRGKILVLESYERMFHHLLLLRKGDKGSRQGVVITGQPGIGVCLNGFLPYASIHQCIRSPGKTTFLSFLLARLISLKQVVLLRSSDSGLLFYHGQVYSRPAANSFTDLPIGHMNLPEDWYFPIWTLLDVDGSQAAPFITRGMNVWPIQASSPQPNRYASWRKQTGAALLGMPLWNMRELMEGYVFNFPVLATSMGFVIDSPSPLQFTS